MNKDLITDIAAIRVCVGYLGEKENHTWWQSSFFSNSSEAFLKPVFNKTLFSAQYYGVKSAATIVHDDHIGVGKDVFHLFRLPEWYEVEIHSLLGDQYALSFLRDLTCHEDAAQSFLLEYNNKKVIEDFGPIRLGGVKDIHEKTAWRAIASHYFEGFKSGNKAFPYFSKLQ
ncbi:BrxE family protein [Desulfobacula sp.]|uniref:BrxE family protein n=1 Tax=Desulfobacula sp. TaxID=2593537 RepID=UPI002607BAF0|nr:BrxE family protein [Desulfobacula sp.]